jgi:hypothetical protein
MLMLNDGCYGDADPVGCRSVINGLFSKGLHAVIQFYSATARDWALALNTTAIMSQTVAVSADVP